MVEILPAILETSFDGVQQKLARIEGVVDAAQLDITDGVFVAEESWHDEDELNGLETGVRFDLHLMVDRPELWIEQWNLDCISRFTFHYEATYDARRTLRIAKKTGKEVGIALKLETPVTVIDELAPELDAALLMAIEPGAQGRPFDPHVLDRVRGIRAKHPKLGIGVDGGVSALTAPGLIDAGATMLVSGSYLFGQEDIKEAIKSLQK